MMGILYSYCVVVRSASLLCKTNIDMEKGADEDCVFNLTVVSVWLLEVIVLYVLHIPYPINFTLLTASIQACQYSSPLPCVAFLPDC